MRLEEVTFNKPADLTKSRTSIAVLMGGGVDKTNTRNELLVIETRQKIAQRVPRGQMLKVKLEVDTDPPGGFVTQTRYLLNPIPFPVRAYTLSDLFAGKMHAILCRR